MAGLAVTREEIHELVTHAHNNGLDRASYVRSELTTRYPGIENVTVRVNGQVFNALDYLVQDVDSYAPSSG